MYLWGHNHNLSIKNTWNKFSRQQSDVLAYSVHVLLMTDWAFIVNRLSDRWMFKASQMEQKQRG